MKDISKALERFKDEFSDNITKVMSESNDIDKETLEVMKHMVKTLRTYKKNE